jgi:putative hydrolase of the HAD superfamily
MVCWTRTLRACGIGDARLAEEIADRYAFWRESTLTPYPEVLEVLAALRGDFRTAILTNGSSDMQHTKMRWAGLDGAVDYTLVSEEFGPAKPDPSIFAYAAQQLGAPPAQCLMVGNNLEADIGGAKAAGMGAVWVNRNGQALPPTTSAPDAVVPDLRGVLRVVEHP